MFPEQQRELTSIVLNNKFKEIEKRFEKIEKRLSQLNLQFKCDYILENENEEQENK